MDGKGKVPNRARSLSRAEENIIWETGQLGCNSSRSLTQTIWWNNCLHFGIRGREEHHSLKIEQFRLETDENGRRYISYTEELSKTRNKGLNFNPRLISPKMCENKTERCPLAIFLLFKSKYPVELRNMGPFYLTVIDAPPTDVWYKLMISVMKIKCLQCNQQYLNVSTPPPLLLKKKIKSSPSPEHFKLDFSRTLPSSNTRRQQQPFFRNKLE